MSRVLITRIGHPGQIGIVNISKESVIRNDSGIVRHIKILIATVLHLMLMSAMGIFVKRQYFLNGVNGLVLT